MSLLSYDELVQLVSNGVITNVVPERINGASIDVTLGDVLLYEPSSLKRISNVGEPLRMERFDLLNGVDYMLEPGEFVLAHSAQMFNLPLNVAAEYKLKSSMARCGLEHLNAGWCDPGWNGSVLTLELKNMTRRHVLRLCAGDPIGQVVFFRCAPVPLERSYKKRGRYNGDKSVMAAKEKKL